MKRHLVGWLISAFIWGLPSSLMADQPVLFGNNGPPTVPFMAPNRLFSVELPTDWQPLTSPDNPDMVEFRMTGRPGTAWLQISRQAVAANSQPRQLLLRAVELRLSKLDHFREILRRDVIVHGLPASSIVGTYWYQGNAQYPRTVEELFVVSGTDAFSMHFECFTLLSHQLEHEVNNIYVSFIPRPALPPPPTPVATDPGDAEDDETPIERTVEKIPF